MITNLTEIPLPPPTRVEIPAEHVKACEAIEGGILSHGIMPPEPFAMIYASQLGPDVYAQVCADAYTKLSDRVRTGITEAPDERVKDRGRALEMLEARAAVEAKFRALMERHVAEIDALQEEYDAVTRAFHNATCTNPKCEAHGGKAQA